MGSTRVNRRLVLGGGLPATVRVGEETQVALLAVGRLILPDRAWTEPSHTGVRRPRFRQHIRVGDVKL